MEIRFVGGTIVGGLIGYGLFYLRYENRQIVEELRENLKETKKNLHHFSNELEEHLQQNTILKEKVGELLTKNNDLANIVGELSRYYYHIKVGSEKAVELAKLLQISDQIIEEKIKHHKGHTSNQTEEIVSEQKIHHKKFF